ncbi:hypothetical protein KFL_000110210 [Klebsormidium nitens]|uniref:Uncharacterized protein n=1 Tax=Klebsormidium nitens TaxID=105231 RepID=A0A1Y1HIK7_KLENI|nr:hypothetical protein KFL_000110210 [Klebsormidium nitens]|eukprot:GAQ78324.1 hypothetical protein KFL_000110210 [Klebsormidium nitens]
MASPWKHLRIVVLHYSAKKIPWTRSGGGRPRRIWSSMQRSSSRQEVQTGEVRAISEWWVKRGNQALKACTTHAKLTRDPEKLIMNILLLKRALIESPREYPQCAHLVGFGKEPEPESFKGYTDKGELLLHVRKRVKLAQEEREGLRAAAKMTGLRLDIEAFSVDAHPYFSGMLQDYFHARLEDESFIQLLPLPLPLVARGVVFTFSFPSKLRPPDADARFGMRDCFLSCRQRCKRTRWPELNAMDEFVAVSPFIPCYRCWFQGCKYEDSKNGAFFMGYCERLKTIGEKGGGCWIKMRKDGPTWPTWSAEKWSRPGLRSQKTAGTRGGVCIAWYLG